MSLESRLMLVALIVFVAVVAAAEAEKIGAAALEA